MSVQFDPRASVTVPLCSLLTDAETRLGRHGTMQIMQHPFFDGTLWENLHSGILDHWLRDWSSRLPDIGSLAP